MPVRIVRGAKCYAIYGQEGKKYYFKCGDKAAEDRARHKAVKQGIAVTISSNGFIHKLSGLRVSFDYDGVLSTDKGKKLLEYEIKEKNKIYIITARQESDDNTDLYNLAERYSIDKSNIIFTDGKDKWRFLKRLQINRHYENNKEQIRKIKENTTTRAILV